MAHRSAGPLPLHLIATLLVALGCTDRTGGDTVTPDGGPVPIAPRDAAPLPELDAAVGDDGGIDAGPSACPPGSSLRRTATTCSSAALTPPGPLTTALASASKGDIIAMAGLDEPAAPCLPIVVCTPLDAPTLLFSDSPESPAQDGVLYADTVVPGRHRLYVYHTNGGATARKFPIVVLNSGTQAAKVTLVRRGLAPPSTSYVAQGKSVLVDWLVDRAPVDVTVPPGTRVLLDAALDQLHASQDELVHAIYDLVVDRPVKISFVSVLATADAAATTAGLSLLTRDASHQRGTFPGADVLITTAGGGQTKGVQRLRLGADVVDDTLAGIDAPTGDVQKLLGNYGMLYRLALRLPAPANAAISARGGPWGGVARLGALTSALPATTTTLSTTTDAIALGALTSSSELQLVSAGGSNLPIDLFLVTP